MLDRIHECSHQLSAFASPDIALDQRNTTYDWPECDRLRLHSSSIHGQEALPYH